MRRMKKNYSRDEFDDEGLSGRRDEKDRYSKYRNSIYDYEDDTFDESSYEPDYEDDYEDNYDR